MSETDDVNAPAATAPRKEYFGAEVFTVVFVSYLASGIYALLSYIRIQVTVKGGFKHESACVKCATPTVYPVLDFFDHLADLLIGFGPPLLALTLLARTPGGLGFGIGLDWRRFGLRIAQGIGFFALIGLPGVGLLKVARAIGQNASLEAFQFPDVWYRLPYLFLSAFQSGFGEEIVVAAFVLTRLRQMGWSKPRALIASATLRGSYHLYQGTGGFVGNFVMGLIFGWWFQRTRKVWPLVIAHFLLDATSFYISLYYPHFVSRVIG